MTIVGIEVLRSPSVAALGAAAGEKVELTYGDKLKVKVSFNYRGLASPATLYGAIGNRGLFGFDEIINSEVGIALPESPFEFTPCERSVSIPITSDISPGMDYDLYVKILEYPEAGAPEVDDVVDVVGITPTYELIQETIYPWAYTFQDNAETCVFEFTLTPEQIPGTRWLGERIVDSFISELVKEGSKLLELRVYEDATPLLWTNYRVEVTATASPLAWSLIIIGVLAILFIVAIFFTIKLVDEVFFKRKPLSEETKKTFSRDTLVTMILDLEPETPPETLAQKSDQELRDLLNRILAEKVPPISWLPFAIASGILVVGGVAIALATRRK